MRRRNDSFGSSSDNDSRDSSVDGTTKTFNIDEDDNIQMRIDNIRTIGKSASFKQDEDDVATASYIS